MGGGLIGKLHEVRVGSIIALKHDVFSVCGYVLQRGLDRVRLSYFDPNNVGYLPGLNHVYESNAADRTYLLERFTSFETIGEPGSRGTLAVSADETFSPYIGDVLLLDSPEGRAVGYLIDREKSHVTLAHQDPNSTIQGFEIKFNGFTPFWSFSDSPRRFALAKFPQYRTLRAVRGEDSGSGAPERGDSLTLVVSSTDTR